MSEKKTKHKQIILKIVTIILIIVTGLLLSKRVLNNKKEEVKNISEKIIVDNGNWNITDIMDYDLTEEHINLENGETKKINLKNQFYKIILDNKLEIDFLGEQIKDDQYKYYIYMNSTEYEPITTELEDSREKVIYSSNVDDTSFSISKYQGVYVLKSKIKKETNGEYIAIVDNEGRAKLSLHDVTAEFSEDLEDINVKKCFDNYCVTSKYKGTEHHYENNSGEIDTIVIEYISRDKDITKEQATELFKSLGKEKLQLVYDIDKYAIDVIEKEDSYRIFLYEDINNKFNYNEYSVNKNGVEINGIISYAYYPIA